MFALSNTPLQEHPWLQDWDDREAGAFVTFEGRVRRVNEERVVTRLEYEGAEPIALREFEKIEADVRARFEILDVRCVHRVGLLELGETAVWIGIAARHRGPAFEACHYVIDELKQRLPIWKKEHYADGDSGWLNAP